MFKNCQKQYDPLPSSDVFYHQTPCLLYTSQLTKINDYSKMNAMYGAQNYTYKNWETSVDAYTTEQYKEFQAAAEAK